MQGGTFYTLLPFILVIVIMYFFLIRPQKKKEKQVNEMRSNLRVGDEIVTIGGIHGTICKVKDEYLTIQVGADKTKLEMTRWSVSRVVSNDPAPRKAAAQEEEEKPVKKSRPKRLDKAEEAPAAAPAGEEASAAAEAPVAEESETKKENE